MCPCLSDLDGFMVTGCFDGLAALGLLVFLATGADDDRACDAGALLESFTGDPAKYLAIAVAVGSAIGMVSVTKITGHTTERSFMKYIRITQEENANKLSNHPFFN